jgi:UDP-N-acetylglucosamine transferase subunit ALG13
MIFVTVGNATQRFPRLLSAVGAMASSGVFGSELVVIQVGHNAGFTASHCQQERFVSPDRFASLMREADVVICHAGAGTLYHAFQAGKVPVVMPRRPMYGEHVEDQLELVKALAAEGRIIPAYEPAELPHAVEAARARKGHGLSPRPSQMLFLVAQALQDMERRGL